MFPFNNDYSSNYDDLDYQTHLQNLFASQLISAPEGSSCDYNNLNTNKIETMTKNDEKKIIHREIERQRRKQMASLLTNLRSLLPLQFIKGRRTRADIVHEAVNYIEFLRGKINDLHIKRDAIIKRKLNLESSSSCYNQSCKNVLISQSCVVMKPYSGGLLEIVISNCIEEENFQLSEVMRVLFQQSIQIESCSSSKVNGRMLHTIIQTKVDEYSSKIDLHELQQKLYQVCNNSK